MTLEDFQCRLEALKAEKCGMIADNKERELAGDHMKYADADFNLLADRFLKLSELYHKQ